MNIYYKLIKIKQRPKVNWHDLLSSNFVRWEPCQFCEHFRWHSADSVSWACILCSWSLVNMEVGEVVVMHMLCWKELPDDVGEVLTKLVCGSAVRDIRTFKGSVISSSSSFHCFKFLVLQNCSSNYAHLVNLNGFRRLIQRWHLD